MSIDERANWIYDFIYNKNISDYDLDNVTINDITIENIKIITDNTTSKQYINDIFNTNIKFDNRIGTQYLFKRLSDPLAMNIFIKLVDNQQINNINSSENMNSAISFLLNNLVLQNKTRHLLLQLINLNIPLEDMLIFLNKHYDNVKELVDLPKRNNKYLNITITERFFKMQTLEEYLQNNKLTDEDFKILLFQIFHTLAVIQDAYPGFRHNQFNLKNIYCYVKEKNVKTMNKYIYGDQVYNLPNNGIDIKIFHYDNAIISDVLDNDDLTKDLKIKNKSYDLLTLIKSIYELNPKNNYFDNLPIETKKFIKEMLTIDKQTNNVELFSPGNIIMNHNYFNLLRNNILNNNIMKKYTETSSIDSESDIDTSIIRGSRKLNRITLNNTESENASTTIVESEEESSSTSSSSSSSEESKNNDKEVTSDSINNLSDISLTEEEKEKKSNISLNNLGNALKIDKDYLKYAPNSNGMMAGMNMMPPMNDMNMMPSMNGMNDMNMMSGMNMPAMNGMNGMNDMNMMPAMNGMNMPAMNGMNMPAMNSMNAINGMNMMPAMNSMNAMNGMNMMPAMNGGGFNRGIPNTIGQINRPNFFF